MLKYVAQVTFKQFSSFLFLPIWYIYLVYMLSVYMLSVYYLSVSQIFILSTLWSTY